MSRRTTDETAIRDARENSLCILRWSTISIQAALEMLDHGRVEPAIGILVNALEEANRKWRRLQTEYHDECIVPFRRVG